MVIGGRHSTYILRGQIKTKQTYRVRTFRSPNFVIGQRMPLCDGSPDMRGYEGSQPRLELPSLETAQHSQLELGRALERERPMCVGVAAEHQTQRTA